MKVLKLAKNKSEIEYLLIESTALPGHEDLIEEAKKDGSITAEKLALKIIAKRKKQSFRLFN